MKLKNWGMGAIDRGAIVLGGNCPGGYCPRPLTRDVNRPSNFNGNTRVLHAIYVNPTTL